MISDLTKHINILVKRKGIQIAEKRTEEIRKNLVKLVKGWRIVIKHLLSRPYNGKRNRSLWPMLRTGALSKSVPSYQVRVRKTFGVHRRALELGEANIVLQRRPTIPPWNTYGETLNAWSKTSGYPSNLDNWKDRAYQKLEDAIIKRQREGFR